MTDDAVNQLSKKMDAGMKPTLCILAVLVTMGCQHEPSRVGENQLPPQTQSTLVTEQSSPDPDLEKLVTQLTSSDVEQRRDAAYLMGGKGGPDAVPHLIKALSDTDLYVRTYAIQSLRDRREPRAVKRLCELLTEQARDPQIVSNVMRALGSIKSSEAVPALVAALDSKEAFTRYDAAFALGEIGDPAAIPALEKLSSDQTKPETTSSSGAPQSTIYSVGEQAQRSINILRGK
jgi:HEAT repeat protein